MSWRVEIIPSAEREYLRLPSKTRQRIRSKMLLLENDPFPPGAKKLRDTNTFRLRSGDYRIVYSIDGSAQLAKIVSIGHRRDVYRTLR